MESNNNEIEKIESDIHLSKTSLAGKWSNLKNDLGGVAHSASEDVSASIQQVKEAISITHQVEKRPWLIFGGSVVAGIILTPLLLPLLGSSSSRRSSLGSKDSETSLAHSLGLRGLTLLGLSSSFLSNILKDVFRTDLNSSVPKTTSSEKRVINKKGESVSSPTHFNV